MERVRPTFVDIVEGAKFMSGEVQLDGRVAVQRYFSQHSSQYINLLQNLNFVSLGEQAGEKKIYVCIPASHEESHIYRTLDFLSQQPERYLRETEVVILDNHKDTELPDGTFEEIVRFNKENPSMRIRYSHIIVSQSIPYGNIRKILFDSTLYRSVNNPSTYRNNILVSCDADVYGFSDNYLSLIAKGLNYGQTPGVLVGSFVYPKEAFRKYPVLAAAFFFHRTYRTLSEQGSNYIPWTSGRTTALTGNLYATIGGLDGTLNRASDIEIGKRIQTLWESGKTIKIERSGFCVVTDPRRVLSKMSLKDRNYSDEFEDIDWTRKEGVYGKSWDEYEYPGLERLTVDCLEKEFGGILIKKAYHQGYVRQLRHLAPQDISDLEVWISNNMGKIKKLLSLLNITHYEIDARREAIINGIRVPRPLKFSDISGVEKVLQQLYE